MVTASVGGRVGDDITQFQDDEGRVRNCSNLFHIYIYFWCKSLGRVTSKVENLVFYKHKIGVLFVEGFCRKAPVFLSITKLFRTLPFTLLRQTAAYKYFHFFAPLSV